MALSRKLISAILPLPITILILSLAGCQQPGNGYMVTRYGAKGDGNTLNTSSIQQAIDACYEAGGGRVVVPPGEFVTGTILLRSHVNLHLEQGARLIGSLDTIDYRIDGRKHGIIYAFQCMGVTLSGEGEIDGRGTRFHLAGRAHAGPDYVRSATRQGEAYLPIDPVPPDGPIGYDARPGMMVVFLQCEQVSIQDLTFRDSPEWTFRIADCDDVLVTGISIHNNLLIPNSDGVHCTTSRNVRISDCDIRAGDDAIIVTGFGTDVGVGGDINTRLDYTSREVGNKTGYAENVVVTNCLLQSRSAGIRVGYGINPIRNCTFSNLVIYGSNRGLGVFSRDAGSIENILFSDIIIHNRLHSGHWWGNGEPVHVSAIRQSPDAPAGPVSHVRFRNIIAESETGMVIWGMPESPVTDVLLEEVSIRISAGKHGEDYGGNFDLRPVYPRELGIFQHDIPALYAQHVHGLRIRGLSVEWGEGLPPYMSHAVYCKACPGLDIDDFTGSAANPSLQQIEVVK